MSKESFKKVLAAVLLLGMVAGTAFVLGSCGKEKTNGGTEKAVANTLPNQGETLLEKMRRNYNRLYNNDIEFVTCNVVEQDNGYTIVIASACSDSTTINFAMLAVEENGVVTVDDESPRACVCDKKCKGGGCIPYLLGNNAWDCTECETGGSELCTMIPGGPTPGDTPPQN